MRIEHKSIPFEVKAVSDGGDTGPAMEGLGACFLSLDKTGDIIAPGAFKDGLDGFLKDGFLGGLDHNWKTPIGHPVEAREVPEGLWFKAVFDDSDVARNTRAMLRVNPESGRATIRKLSIGYRAVETKTLGPAEVKAYWQTKGYRPGEAEAKAAEARKSTRLLNRVDLFEVSPVVIPANDNAAVLSAKSFGGYGPSMGGEPSDTIPHSMVETHLAYLCMQLHAAVSNEIAPVDDILKFVRDAYAGNCDGLVEYLRFALTTDAVEDASEGVAEAVETMAAKFKSLLPEQAQYTVKALAPGPGVSLDDYFPTVEPALRDFCARNRDRLDIRLKEGRVLSSANVERMERMRDSLRSHADDLHSMVETARPKPKDKDGHAGRSPFGGLPTGVMATVSLGGKAESADTDLESKGGHPVLEGPWDAGAAEGRVRKWASKDGSGDRDTLDWEKYGRAFAHVDEAKAGPSFDAHHAIHHDVADGKLHVSRKGVLAAASADHPEAHAGAIRGHLGGHFDALKMTAPWDKGKGEDKSAEAADDATPSAPPMPNFSAFFKQFYATDPLLIGAGVAQS